MESSRFSVLASSSYLPEEEVSKNAPKLKSSEGRVWINKDKILIMYSEWHQQEKHFEMPPVIGKKIIFIYKMYL